MKTRKFKLTLDVELDIDPNEYVDWRLNKRYLRETILAQYFYDNGVELNQDIKIEEITDETKN